MVPINRSVVFARAMSVTLARVQVQCLTPPTLYEATASVAVRSSFRSTSCRHASLVPDHFDFPRKKRRFWKELDAV